ncbi:hypothetical protein [Novosphingobium soli]|uniref:MFS transporter n=1 Tax=Novosphingobium soli TaxID=574956 RepID=A0ABV6CZR9_9SPHN
MLPITAPTSGPGPQRTAPARTRLDWVIIVSLLAMGALNLLALADKVGVAQAQAAPVHACGAPLA